MTAFQYCLHNNNRSSKTRTHEQQKITTKNNKKNLKENTGISRESGHLLCLNKVFQIVYMLYVQ